METNEILQSLKQDIAELKKALTAQGMAPSISPKWVSRKEVMAFLDYAPTQMAALEKSGEIIVTKVGKRKFILRESIEKFLDRNIQNPIS